MFNLPTEVFLRVISFLDDKADQITCLHVCKSWCTQIQQAGSLYSSVTIRDARQLHNCTSFFELHAEFKPQVKELTINAAEITEKNLLQLPKTFPHVEKFTHNEEQSPIREWNQKEADAAFAPWASTLHSLTETGSPIVGPTLLAKHKCKNLVSLTFSFVGYEDESKKSNFIKHLKNAPDLQYLQLQWMNVKLADVDMIFKRTPNLKALGFLQVGFEPSKVRHSITPAPQFESLCIDQAYFAPGDRSWISWFTQKCENMKHFVLKISDEDDEYEPTGWLEMQIKALLRHCNQLEYYNVQACPLTEDIVKAMNENKQLKLKRICIYGMELGDDLKVLANSSQKDSIESLTLSGTPYCSMTYGKRAETQFYKNLGKFTNLKHLRINESKEEVMGQKENVVPLDRFLEMPNLESLTMDFCTYEISDTSDEPFNTNMKTLVLEEGYVGSAKFAHLKPEKYSSDSYKQDEIYHDESTQFLESKLPPYTEFIERDMDEEPTDAEYAYLFNQ